MLNTHLSTLSKKIFKTFAQKKPIHVLIVDIFTHKPTELGRWKLCDKDMIDTKIDLNNNDHCGTCGLDKYYSK